MRQSPYPADTRAKGWRFELDHERIEQSDTWSLAPAELRPWLLMLWMTAWKQTPCGSLADDDALIAARLGMSPKLFAKHRAVLMRGWWKADDERLYHDTVAQRVLEMLAKRAKDAERAANRRARMADTDTSTTGVTGESRVTPYVLTREFDTKHQAPSTREHPERAGRKRPADPPKPEDVASQVWTDWCALRRRKRANVDQTAIEAARGEAQKAGLTFEQFLCAWCLRGSQGLEASWLKPQEIQRLRGSETVYQQSQRERVAEFAPSVAKRPAAIDVESSNVLVIAGR